jgi:GNAT superfamily N-acetyltransferase
MAQFAVDKIQISQATLADTAAIAEVLEDAQQWLSSRGINQWKAPFSNKWIEQKVGDQEFYLVRCDRLFVAVLRLLWSDPEFWGDDATDAAYVHSLAVRQAWRGRGIGRLALHWAETQAKIHGKSFLRLDCTAENTKLCTYYRQFGFTSCGVRQVGEWNVHLFQKSIPNS